MKTTGTQSNRLFQDAEHYREEVLTLAQPLADLIDEIDDLNKFEEVSPVRNILLCSTLSFHPQNAQFYSEST